MAKRIMTKFRIDELSAVDKPAQEGATMVIMKRDGMPVPKADESKSDFMARCDDHAVMKDKFPDKKKRRAAAGGIHDAFMEGSPGEESAETPEEEAAEGDAEKRAPYWKADFTAEQRSQLADSGAAMPDGSFPIRNKADLENALHAQGRAKDVEAARRHIKSRAKALGLESMLPDSFGGAQKSANPNGEGPNMDEKKMEEMSKRLATLEGELAQSRAFGQLSDADKVHYAGLDESGRGEFLKKDRSERASILAKAAESNPVVYTAENGMVFRKNDDARVISMAKDNDELRKANRESQKAVVDANLAKRASDEFKSLPGEAVAKVELLRAVSTIADEATRGKVEGILKVLSTTMGKAFVALGHKVSASGASPVEQLDALAKNLAETRKITLAEAKVAVLDTPEGQALYAQTTQPGQGI
jgi:hypothetical protein